MAALPVIGSTNWKYVRGKRTAPYNNDTLLSFLAIPYIEVARFIGLVDAEGVVSIARDDTHIKAVLKVSLNLRDLTLLTQLRDTFLGIGRI